MSAPLVSLRPAAGVVRRASSGAGRRAAAADATAVTQATEADLIYFSSVSGNTARFVERVVARTGRPAARIPLHAADPELRATRPYLLALPTYGGGNGHGAVPKQVIRFLNHPGNRALLRGVVVGGNTNFGTGYGLAGDIVAAKCQVPCLYKFELFGTDDDVDAVVEGMERFWTRQ